MGDAKRRNINGGEYTTVSVMLIDDLTLAHRLADAADDISLRYFMAGGVSAQTKADGSLVTAADREVERTLRSQVKGRSMFFST